MRHNGKSGQRLTIAHFMPWSGIGGVEIATLRLVDATRERFRHVAFCLPDAAALRDSFEKGGVETVTYLPPEPSVRHAACFFGTSLNVARQIRKVKADIVHFSDGKAAYQNSLAALLAHCKTVFHVRVTNSHFSLRQRLCFAPIGNFVFVSEEARRTFALSLPDHKTRVIYDAIEVTAAETADSNAAVRCEFGIPRGCTIVGVVARVAPQKDFYTLASAALEVLRRYPDTVFLVVGDNSLVDLNRSHYEEVSKKLDELGIASSFRFTGHRTDVNRLLGAMDISVLCTHREGFPLSILESMAKRKPVVATAVGGIPEIIKHGVTGYLHQHGNSKELADAIISLIEDPEQASRIGLAGYDLVRKDYSLQEYIDNLTKIYSDVMRG